ncbi:MAG TPA: hypothetical protein PK646_05915 [Bacillota bacterium]|jgi:hypothetical protein|nr:hypothetical protein [Fastidiosipila sp.]HPX93779.1 hypothetical protein [Bacillota bacterium]HQB81604.1 hypothetical protein [Bacillota bacterium]
MKLIIKQQGKRGIRLWFPNRMIFSKMAFKIYKRSLAKDRRKAESGEIKSDKLDDFDSPAVKKQDQMGAAGEVEKTVSREIRTHVIETIDADGIKETVRQEVREAVDANGIRETIRKEIRESIRDGNPSRRMEWRREVIDTKKEASEKSSGFEQFISGLPDEKIGEVMKIFRRMKKDYPGVPLVDVRSSEGDRVLIQL